MSLTYVLKDVQCRFQLDLVPVANTNGLYAQDAIPKIVSAVDGKLLTYLHIAINIWLSRLRKCWVCNVLSRVIFDVFIELNIIFHYGACCVICILFYFINTKTTVFIHVIFLKCTMYKWIDNKYFLKLNWIFVDLNYYNFKLSIIY